MVSNVSVVVWHGVQYSVDVCSKLSMCRCVDVWMCGMVSNVWLCGAAWMDSNFLFPTVREAAARGKFINGDEKWGHLTILTTSKRVAWQQGLCLNFAIDTIFSVNLIKRTIEARCSKLSCCYGFYDCDNINFWTYGIIIRLLTFESPTFVFQLIIGPSCKSEEIMALANCVSSNWLKGG